MRRYAILTLVLGVLGTSLPAAAQEAGVQYQKKTVIDFSTVDIDGELTKPQGDYMVSRKKTTFSNLIRERTDFLDELQTSVDNL